MAKRGKEKETENLLLENFIALQKKLVETVKDLKELKQGVSELLEIFKRAEQELKNEKRISLEPKIEEKLDKLLEQNKTIAEAIVAIGENLQTELDKQKEVLSKFEKFEKSVEKEKVEKKKKLEEEEEEEAPSEYDLEPLPEFNF